MNSIKSPNRGSPNKRFSYPNYVYIKEVKQNWLREPPKIIIPVSIGESKMIYRMTLGSLYYDNEIKKVEAKESETQLGRQTITFLKTKYPTLWRKWVIIKNETNNHLEWVAVLWKKHILNPVDKILFELKRKFPMLVKYKNLQDKNEF